MEGQHQNNFEDFIAERLVHRVGVIDAERFPETQMSDDDQPAQKDGGEADGVSVEAIAPVALAKTATPETISNDPHAAGASHARIDVKVEKSLMTLGFFTPSSRRVKKEVKRISFTRTVDGKKVEASAEFHPSPAFGLPITADQDKFLALHYIIAERMRSEGRIENPIRFTTPELCRLLNIKSHGGRNYSEVNEWLDVMSTTTIISNGVIYEKDKENFVTSRDRFHVFERARTIGQTMPDGSVADANYVWLSEWQLKNLNEKYLLPVDLETYRELTTRIAKALVPLLQIWLFATQTKGSFEKKYDELCEMLSLKVHKVPSLIKQQLRPAFDELVRHEYLSEWQIARTIDHRSYKVIFFHGAKFRRDRRRALEEKARAEQVVVVAESEPVELELPIPGRLEEKILESDDTAASTPTNVAARVRTRAAKTKSQPPTTKNVSVKRLDSQKSESLEAELVDILSGRGLMPSQAMKLLRTLSDEQLRNAVDYVDYWDEVRKTKDVGEGFLYSLIKEGQPLPANFETRRKREERLAMEKARDERDRKLLALKRELEEGYENHCRLMIDRFISEELPAGEFERRVEVRKAELVQQGGLWSSTMPAKRVAEFAVRAVRDDIAKSGVVVAFEDYRQRQLPIVLARLGLDPVELGLKSNLKV